MSYYRSGNVLQIPIAAHMPNNQETVNIALRQVPMAERRKWVSWGFLGEKWDNGTRYILVQVREGR